MRDVFTIAGTATSVPATPLPLTFSNSAFSNQISFSFYNDPSHVSPFIGSISGTIILLANAVTNAAWQPVISPSGVVDFSQNITSIAFNGVANAIQYQITSTLSAPYLVMTVDRA